MENKCKEISYRVEQKDKEMKNRRKKCQKLIEQILELQCLNNRGSRSRKQR